MTQAAKAQEPSMEEILASIRRIIADDDAAKAPKPEPAKPAAVRPAPAPAPAKPAAAPPPAPAPAPAANSQDDIDAMLAGFDAPMEKPAAPEPVQNDILDLTEAMTAPEPAPSAPALRAIDGGGADSMFDETPAVPEPSRAVPSTIQEARRQFHESTGSDRSLLSATTTSAVDSAFNTLAQTVLVQNSQTLDGLVREMLRPMLKAWLDDNLPTLVERLVRAEIERVSRGRG